jgi:hypothetical protein
MRILFIHRSVGKDLLRHGKLRELLNAKGVQLNDYNNNDGLLTTDEGATGKWAVTMPGDNTNPDNLAELFAGWPDILNKYDMIMIKSCYPNSHIKSEAQLESIKQQYQSIFESFKAHKKPLFILTTPPLRPLFTNAQEAVLADGLADWLVSSAKGNIHVFDFRSGLVASSGKHKGMLKGRYRRLAPWDNHPNRIAHQIIAPRLAALIAQLKNR